MTNDLERKRKLINARQRWLPRRLQHRCQLNWWFLAVDQDCFWSNLRINLKTHRGEKPNNAAKQLGYFLVSRSWPPRPLLRQFENTEWRKAKQISAQNHQDRFHMALKLLHGCFWLLTFLAFVWTFLALESTFSHIGVNFLCFGVVLLWWALSCFDGPCLRWAGLLPFFFSS